MEIGLAGNSVPYFGRQPPFGLYPGAGQGPSVIYSFETQNTEFQFRVDPAGGEDVAMMEREFQKFLNLHPHAQDRELYRTFEIRPWQFWNWYYYSTSDVYEYPYKARKVPQ